MDDETLISASSSYLPVGLRPSLELGLFFCADAVVPVRLQHPVFRLPKSPRYAPAIGTKAVTPKVMYRRPRLKGDCAQSFQPAPSASDLRKSMATTQL